MIQQTAASVYFDRSDHSLHLTRTRSSIFLAMAPVSRTSGVLLGLTALTAAKPIFRRQEETATGLDGLNTDVDYVS